MLKNYIISAFRNLVRHRIYSVITILGLGIGLAGCLLIVGYVNNELTFESFHQYGDRIYRIDGLYAIRDSQVSMASIMPALGPALRESVPEIEKVVRIYRFWDLPVELPNGDKITASKAFAAEPEYLEIFTFPLKYGNPGNALTEPFSILISEEIADKYFPDQNPLGMTVTVDDEHELSITGVIKDSPDNSQLKSDFVLSYSTLEQIGQDTKSWTELFSAYTYVLLNSSADPKTVDTKISEVIAAHVGEEEVGHFQLQVKPLKDIYLHSDWSYELPPDGDVAYVYIFAVVAFLLLTIACLNFINISTSQATRRVKEVGIRKVLGAFRSNLVKQHLTESMIVTIISMFLGIALMELAKPQLEIFLERPLELNLTSDPVLILSVFAMIAVVGLISGSYPAYLLSRYTPSAIIRGQILGDASRSTLRRVFVTIQFIIAISILCATIAIHNQVDYSLNTDLGFDEENVVLIDVSAENITYEKQKLLKNEILSGTPVLSAALTYCTPGENRWSLYSMRPENKLDEDPTFMHVISADADLLKTMGLQIIEGGNISNSDAPESKTRILVNKMALDYFAMENPIGFTFHAGERVFTVVGVVDDFHQHSLQHEIMPIGIFPLSAKTRLLAAKLPPGRISETLAEIKQVWEKINPEAVFEYSFLKDSMLENYKAEKKLGTLFTVFSSLTLFVGCLGLFGLAVFSTEQRVKEIGIRKVLGASMVNILGILSRETIFLVIAANIIAWPIAYYIISGWLETFAYKSPIRWQYFVTAGLIALLISLATISYQAVKAAISDPVKTLKYE